MDPFKERGEIWTSMAELLATNCSNDQEFRHRLIIGLEYITMALQDIQLKEEHKK